MESNGRGRRPPPRLVSVPASDALYAICEEPVVIENAVRTALFDAMTWRLGGGSPPSERAFAFAAVAAAHQQRSRSNVAGSQRADEIALRRAAAAAALRFFRAQLGKRLMTLPEAQILETGSTGAGADVVIRDRQGHLHLIALTALGRPLEIGARAREVAERTYVAARDRLSCVRVHMFSLATGTRHESHGWTIARSSDDARTA